MSFQHPLVIDTDNSDAPKIVNLIVKALENLMRAANAGDQVLKSDGNGKKKNLTVFWKALKNRILLRLRLCIRIVPQIISRKPTNANTLQQPLAIIML